LAGLTLPGAISILVAAPAQEEPRLLANTTDILLQEAARR